MNIQAVKNIADTALLQGASFCPELAPHCATLLRALLREDELLRRTRQTCSGPLHILLPQHMEQNAADFRNCFSTFDIDTRILFAHKPTKSTVFLRQARTLRLGVDVASFEELVSALSSGFCGEQIECTGPKTDRFLELALLQGCTLSVDSISELKRVALMQQTLELEKSLRVLLRVTDISTPGRNIRGRVSRFGIPESEISVALEYLQSHPNIELLGFHVHNDRRESSDRAAQVQGLLNLTVEAFRQGFHPSVINIGGGFRRKLFEKPTEWNHYVEFLESCLVRDEMLPTVGSFAYGMSLNDRGKVVGRTKALAHGAMPDFLNVLPEVLRTPYTHDGSIAGFIRENDLSLWIEPGAALLDQCGISLFEVIDVKCGGGHRQYAVLDANFYNIAGQYREFITDPLVLSKNGGQEREGYFLVGNLCREEDFLIRREVFLPHLDRGDILVFTNTAAYRADFEDAAPHQHPRGQKIIALEKDGAWQMIGEARYHARSFAALPAQHAKEMYDLQKH